ncbi:histidine phosphatase family protein [Neotabrizicola sp. VNH66]|uniref:histidine phosphatase family protein n=1 Tax=Neotabrizicola sp. VNH66 TaxID=3400918 RepID=UPI003C020322
MTLVLTLVAHGPTAATRQAAFPGDDPLLPGSGPGPLPWRGRRVLASPARACQETAAALSLLAERDPALAEMDHGRWSGKPLAEVAAAEPEALARWIADPDYQGHGGESRAALALRVADWLERIAAGGSHVLALTHASVIRALVLRVLDAPAAAFWALDVGPATLTELRHDGRRWALRALACPLPAHRR